MKWNNLILIIFFTALIISCGNEPKEKKKKKKNTTKNKSAPIINYTYVNSFPHDTNSFTEGFLIHNGELYESTGANDVLPQTKSLFGIVDSATGIIDTKVELDRTVYFGEGITFLNDKVYQLTYQAKIGFIYDAITFKELGTFKLPSNEGWGMTTDGKDLIMSDGSANIYFLDAANCSVKKIISVADNGIAIDNLNELEYIKGFIYANLWMTNFIVKIEPSTGKVVGKLDLTALFNEVKYYHYPSMAMNGIAYDSIADRVFVTGKMWPKYFEIRFKL